jgi:predicted 3-demethylubiquinone-9 3-methyltransferase (glyoxalase superfamily)
MPKQKITPNLWFDHGQVESAAMFYLSVFDNAKVGSVTRAGNLGYDITGIAPGEAITVELEIEGHKFIGINGGPLFKFNPSISFLVACKTRDEVDRTWEKLAVDGEAMMDIGKYPHSERYGWIKDRYGVSWQIMAMGNRPIRQKVVPTLMFVGPQYGKAENAVSFYTRIFRQAKVGNILRYTKGEEPDREGTIKHADFKLEGQEFAAMDSGRSHNFTFNEAVSLLVSCTNQKEVDYYWEKLTEGGEEGMCGWLKDRFGVSWQVAPNIMGKLLSDRDPAKVERVTAAFLKMKKFDIAAIKKAFRGENT